MNLEDFTDGSIWAINRAALDGMVKALPGVYEISDLAQAGNGNSFSQKPELTITDGVAVIPVIGSISKRPGFMSFLFGGSSIDRIRAELETAIEDPDVKGVVLYFDSPGGTVPGVAELADYIYRAREIKPIVSYSDGQITSAATWIGSAASQKIISPTARDGSIGVLVVHRDYSKMDEKLGVKYTYLSAGKYKAVGNPDEPLAAEARKIIEGQINQVYNVFVSDIARFRGVEKRKVLNSMADGMVFIGQTAVEAGLADSLGCLEDAIALAGGEGLNSSKSFRSVASSPTHASSGIDTKYIMEMAAAHFGEDAADSFSKIISKGITLEQYSVFKEVAGGSAVGRFSLARQDPDAEFKARMLQGICGASAPDPGCGSGFDSGSGNGPTSYHEAVNVIMKEDSCTKGAAIKRVVAEYPDLHKQYIQSVNPNVQI